MQFSTDLNLGHSNVSWLIVTGRRRITEASLKKIVSGLNLHSLEARYFRYMVRYNNSKKVEDKKRFFRLLLDTRSEMVDSSESKSQLRYLSNWFHPVIREMCGMEEFYSEERWIMSRLYSKLLPREVKESLNLLEELGLIKYSRNKQRHILTEKHLGPKKEVVNIGMEGFHRKMLEVAADSIAKVPEDRRDFNALSVSISEEQVEELKKMIHEFCVDAMKLEEKSTKPDQVYQVNVHMFPFTRGK